MVEKANHKLVSKSALKKNNLRDLLVTSKMHTYNVLKVSFVKC